MTQHTFAAVLIRPQGIGTWTYFNIPFSLIEAYGIQGRLPVKGTVNDHPFSTSALPHGDRTHYVVVPKAIRDRIHTEAGDTVQVVLERDPAPRTITPPADLRRALAQNRPAAAAFKRLSYSHQKEYVDWIEAARQPATRTRRIARAVEMIAAGLPARPH